MAHDKDNPLGVEIRGNERSMHFVHPYRRLGELNQVERWKLERHPLEVADAVISRYAKEGPGAIAKVAGEQERLKWVGLYPQRQGGDAFMMRVKVPGGVLSADQAREIGVVADAFGEGPDDSAVFGNRYADITTRQTIQIHWIRIGDVPRIWERFADVGLTTVQACGDSARNVLSCPVSGVDAEEVFDALPVARAISDFFTGNREYANLPRKFKISVSGCRENCAKAEINDIGLWPARVADGTLGFNVLAGGGLSDGERMASDIDVFVRPEQAVEITRAIAQLFGELGNRESRGLARMRYLVQELGPEQFRAELAARARFELAPAGEELTTRYRGDHVGVHPQIDPGLRYVGCSVPVGRMSGIELVEAARLARTYGDGTIRLGTDQNFVLTGVPADRVDTLLDEELLAKYSPFPGPFERGVVACTGSEFYGERAATAVPSPRREDAGVIRMHFSGCSASCAQPQIADIGFRGDVAHVGERIVEAVDIGMGGALGPAAGFIDWIENARPVDDVPDALLRTVRRYRAERRQGEPFYNWARRVPNEELRATLAGLDTDRVSAGNP
jgi:ferredoxin-nitrite reductase